MMEQDGHTGTSFCGSAITRMVRDEQEQKSTFHCAGTDAGEIKPELHTIVHTKIPCGRISKSRLFPKDRREGLASYSTATRLRSRDPRFQHPRYDEHRPGRARDEARRIARQVQYERSIDKSDR